MSESTIPWYALFGLMTVGRGPLPTLRGVVRVVSFDPEDDEEPVETLTRVWVDGERVRRESLDGQLESIDGEEDQWVWDVPDQPPVCDPHSRSGFVEDGGLLSRRDQEIWDDEEDERPIEPIRSTTCLGRAAWDVRWENQPKRRMLIDDETGLVLHQSGLAAFIPVAEWVELTVGEALDDSLFAWEGSTRPGDDDPHDHSSWEDYQPMSRSGSLRQHVFERLQVLAALDTALTRWDEVTALGAASANASAFVHGLRSLLGVDEMGARAVTDLQLRRLSVRERTAIADEVADLRRELADLDG
ncbi:hypothetical protein FE697_020790 [Mumia zhuanghuii]|uniref:Uncharacterized protein n=2 Tax=Mumia TaxID=1546255 RepID=A0ABW1QJ64_9ACTN|nr:MULTISPECIES: hypothetical protein [Mumia]KAA1418267.1 hypothetical protein FE697_020790 [Mumia zhuanghuii]